MSDRDPVERASFYASEFTDVIRMIVWPDNFKKMRKEGLLFNGDKNAASNSVFFLNTTLAWVKKMLHIL